MMICGSSLSRNGTSHGAQLDRWRPDVGQHRWLAVSLYPWGSRGPLPWGRGPLQKVLAFLGSGRLSLMDLDLRMIQVDTVGLYLPQTNNEVDSGAWLEIGVGFEMDFRPYVICDSYLSTLLVHYSSY